MLASNLCYTLRLQFALELALTLFSSNTLTLIRQVLKFCKGFYWQSPDGAVYAKNSRIDSIMELPFFKMTLDNNLQYNVHYKKSLRELISVMSPREQQFYDKMKTFKITDAKARPPTKLW